MDEAEFKRVKRRLMRGFRRRLAEAEQCIRDIDYYNQIHPEHRPIDTEWFKAAASGFRKAIKALEENRPINLDWLPSVVD